MQAATFVGAIGPIQGFFIILQSFSEPLLMLTILLVFTILPGFLFNKFRFFSRSHNEKEERTGDLLAVIQSFKGTKDAQVILDVVDTITSTAIKTLDGQLAATKIDKKTYDRLAAAYQAQLSAARSTLAVKVSPETEKLSEHLKRLREEAEAREAEIRQLSEKLKKYTPSQQGSEASTSFSHQPTLAPRTQLEREISKSSSTTTMKTPISSKPKSTLGQVEEDLGSFESVPDLFATTDNGETLIKEMQKAIASIMEEYQSN